MKQQNRVVNCKGGIGLIEGHRAGWFSSNTAKGSFDQLLPSTAIQRGHELDGPRGGAVKLPGASIEVIAVQNREGSSGKDELATEECAFDVFIPVNNE